MDYDAKKFPEHEKLSQVKEQSQWLGGFIDWLRNEDHDGVHYDLGQYTEDDYGVQRLVPAHKPIEKWLAEYLDIDLMKIEEEKRMMLDEFRKSNPSP